MQCSHEAVFLVFGEHINMLADEQATDGLYDLFEAMKCWACLAS
jgi:hypothetical protein